MAGTARTGWRGNMYWRRALYDGVRCITQSSCRRRLPWLQQDVYRQQPLQQHGVPRKPGVTRSTATISASEVIKDAGSSEGHIEIPQEARLVLVDAMALMFRMHFGFSSTRLETQGGEDTSIAYGFVNVLLNLLELRPPPTHFVVVFDAEGKTFRHELFPGYKGQRPPMPGQIVTALPRVREVVRSMGIAEISAAGVEADDVIGTLSARAIQQGFKVAIASPDKDFFQLLVPGLQLLRPPKRDNALKATVAGMVPYNVDAFEEEFGITPSQWVDCLALMGDSTDNVPGVKGIGPKSAIPLVQQFGNLEAVLDHASEVPKKKQREELMSVEGSAAARLSKRLVVIRSDLDIPPVRAPLEELRLRAPSPHDRKAIAATFTTMEFKAHARRLGRVWQNLFDLPADEGASTPD